RLRLLYPLRSPDVPVFALEPSWQRSSRAEPFLRESAHRFPGQTTPQTFNSALPALLGCACPLRPGQSSRFAGSRGDFLSPLGTQLVHSALAPLLASFGSDHFTFL